MVEIINKAERGVLYKINGLFAFGVVKEKDGSEVHVFKIDMLEPKTFKYVGSLGKLKDLIKSLKEIEKEVM